MGADIVMGSLRSESLPPAAERQPSLFRLVTPIDPFPALLTAEQGDKPNGINHWSKRASPQEPQSNDSIDRDFRISVVRPVYLLSLTMRFFARWLTSLV